MKFYSEYTQNYVTTICNKLNSRFENLITLSDKPFELDSFESLTDFLQNYIVYDSNLYKYLDSLGLVNTGKCPYTGKIVNNSSPSWSFMNTRLIYLSQEGLLIMRKEEDEKRSKLFRF